LNNIRKRKTRGRKKKNILKNRNAKKIIFKKPIKTTRKKLKAKK
jgi:hypothetical protein